MNTFAELVEELHRLSKEEMEEIRSLLDKFIVEVKREEILRNGEETRKAVKEGKLEFTDDPVKLIERLNNL